MNLLTRLTGFIKDDFSYPSDDSERDLRIDYIRGIVMLVMILIHIELFSLYYFLIWERIGLIAGAEGFVILSGFVLGMVYKKRVFQKGWRNTTFNLFSRASLLYCVNIFIITSIGLISLIPWVNASQVMSYTDRGSGTVYPLYPAMGTKLEIIIGQALSLRIGPHQTQILGLYIFLLLLTPLALWFFSTDKTRYFLLISWIIYIFNRLYPYRLTGCQFEYAFPLLTWQLIFFHGMAAGYHRNRIAEFTRSTWKRPFLIICGIVFLGFFFFAQNHTNPFLPSWSTIHIIKPAIFNKIYVNYFQKNTLGILRLVNYFVVLVVAYWILTSYWKIFNRLLGWFFIPMGQASLYVFIVHVYFVLLVSNFFPFGFSREHMLLNTLVHTGVLIVIWALVRKKILFDWIPR